MMKLFQRKEKKPTEAQWIIAEKHLGEAGRYLPGSDPIHNANVCIRCGKIWWGDLLVEISQKRLQDLADELQEKIYVLRERDGRFNNEDKPLLGKALYVFRPAKKQL